MDNSGNVTGYERRRQKRSGMFMDHSRAKTSAGRAVVDVASPPIYLHDERPIAVSVLDGSQVRMTTDEARTFLLGALRVVDEYEAWLADATCPTCGSVQHG